MGGKTRYIAKGGGGGGTWVFFGWAFAAWDSKLAPRSKNNFPLTWANPVHGDTVARGSRQNTPALHAKTHGATRVQLVVVNALNRIYKSNLSLNNFKWLLTKLELSRVPDIIPCSRKRL